MSAENTLEDHERTVNRLCWHPTESFLLFSGSQDGTVRQWVRCRWFRDSTHSTRSLQDVRQKHASKTFSDTISVRGDHGWLEACILTIVFRCASQQDKPSAVRRSV